MKDRTQNKINNYKMENTRKKRLTRILSVFVVLTFLCTAYAMILPATTLEHASVKDYESDAGGPSSSTGVLLVMGSDFQDPTTSGSSNFNTQKTRLITIMNLIKTAQGTAYQFIGGGDYGFDSNLSTSNTTKGINAVKEAVDTVWSGVGTNGLYVQGNHDSASADGIASYGSNDTPYYGVYILNEDYFMSEQKGRGSAVNTAASLLDTYLSGRLVSHNDQPVFICSHVPLHFSTRTAYNSDNVYAKYIFDVVNRYAENLNIIFVFGHNHAWGDDDYLGGGSVYLAKGDTIYIPALGSNDEDQMLSETLNFTYLNYGYTGYLWDGWVNASQASTAPVNKNADNTLTMTSFLITGNDVEIRRWDENGQHNLKSAGTATLGKRGVSEVCPINSAVVTGSKTVTEQPLSSVKSGTGILSPCSSLLTASAVTSGDDYEAVKTALGSENFALYDITLDKTIDMPSDGVTLYLPVTEEEHVYSYGTDGLEPVYASFVSVGSSNYMRFNAMHFSDYLTSPDPAGSDPEGGIDGGDSPADPGGFNFPENPGTSAYWVKCTSTNDLSLNDTYLILYEDGNSYISLTANGNQVTSTNVTVAEISGTSYYSISGITGSCMWNISKDGKIKPNGTNRYLSVNKNNISITNTETQNNIVDGFLISRYTSGDTYTIRYNRGFNSDKKNASSLNIYRQIEVDSNQLAVQKIVTEYRGLATEDSEYTFKLLKNGTAAVSSQPYTVYTGNTQTYAGQTSNDGSFKLKHGQTAYFSLPPFGTDTYIVQETLGSDTGYSVTVYRNGSTVSASGSNGNYSVPVVFANGQSGISFTNAPMYRQLAVGNNVTEYRGLATEGKDYVFKLLKNGSAVTNQNYTVYTGNTKTSEGKTGTDGTFRLKNGQTAYMDLPGTGNEPYSVVQVLGSEDFGFEVSVERNGSAYTTTGSNGSYTVPVTFDNEQGTITFTNAPYELKTLTVEKEVPVLQSGISIDTHFYFNLVKDVDSNIKTGVTANYTIYEPDDSVKSTGTTDTDGQFVLSSGQKIVFILTDNENSQLYVEEHLNPNMPIESVAAALNGNIIDDIQTGTLDYSVPVTFVNDSATVKYTNTAAVPDVATVTFRFNDGATQDITVETDESGKLNASDVPRVLRADRILEYWSTVPDDRNYAVFNLYDRIFANDTVLYAHWKTDAQGTLEPDVRLTKVLRTSTAYDVLSVEEGGNYENFFDIDLGAVVPEDEDKVIVLVMDLSSSMDVQCLNCGAIHSGSSNSTSTITGYDGTQYRFTTCSNFQKRLPVIQDCAVDFINDLYTTMYGADGNNGNEQKVYIQIIGFAQTAWEVLGETELSSNKQAIITAIRGMKSDSGTNIAAGLKMGYERLNISCDAHDVPYENSCVMFLSDGAPTTNVKSEGGINYTAISQGYSNPNSVYYLDCEDALDPDYMAYWQNIWYQYGQYSDNGILQTRYEWKDSGFATNYSGTGSGANTQTKVYNPRQIMGSPWYADQIRETGARLYSVVVGTNQDINKWDTANNYKYVSGIGIDNYDYVRSFSDSAAWTNTEEGLEAYYGSIIDNLMIVTSSAVVTDPMSDNVEFVGFNSASDITVDGYTVYLGSKSDNVVLATYDPAARSITWNPKLKNNLSYKVRLKNEAEGFLDWNDHEESYITNGDPASNIPAEQNAMISATVTKGTQTVDVVKSVPSPHVHGWLGMSFTKYGGYDWNSASILPGAVFELRHDPTTCEVCKNIAAADRANLATYQATSDTQGIVSFENIPSGHSYTLVEISSPAGYTTSHETYNVAIRYDRVAVTPSGTGENWNNANFSMLDPEDTGYELPETGGQGTLGMTLCGLILMALSTLMYGVRFRRSKERN